MWLWVCRQRTAPPCLRRSIPTYSCQAALMFDLVPYENSDRSEFSEEGLHGFLSDLNDEIIEEEKRRKEPPDPESANHILLQIQQTVGQMAGQMKELQSCCGEARQVRPLDRIPGPHLARRARLEARGGGREMNFEVRLPRRRLAR